MSLMSEENYIIILNASIKIDGVPREIDRIDILTFFNGDNYLPYNTQFNITMKVNESDHGKVLELVVEYMLRNVTYTTGSKTLFDFYSAYASKRNC